MDVCRIRCECLVQCVVLLKKLESVSVSKNIKNVKQNIKAFQRTFVIMPSREIDREHANSRTCRYDDFTACDLVFLKLRILRVHFHVTMNEEEHTRIFQFKGTRTHIFIFKSISHLPTLMIFLPISSLVCSRSVAVVV